MSFPPPGTPVAPEFVGYRDGRPVRVRFDQERSAILTSEEEGRPAAAMPWTEASELLRIDGAEFVCRWAPAGPALRLEVHDDDYGMALAFVEFVNRRRPVGDDDFLGGPIPDARRFQYAVVPVDLLDSLRQLTGLLARAGPLGWEMVTVHDRPSDLLGAPGRGVVLLKREIPEGVEITDWCITVRR